MIRNAVLFFTSSLVALASGHDGRALAPGADCSKTSVGFTPLGDLGTDAYRGYEGGLYPGGANAPPADHRQAALARAASITPLATGGAPDPAGRIVVLSVGMSNATQEYSEFIRLARTDPRMSARVLLVDGAQGGQTASIVRDPAARYWQVVDERLGQAGSSKEQVQVIWLKEANAQPRDPFPAHAQALQADLQGIVQVAHDRFPNLKLLHLSSRTYGGYASTTLNPEPYAYESAFAVKWLIKRQIDGDPALNPDPARGPVRAPILLWGPYLWADGLKPRSDGLVWRCEDFAEDGTHPSTTGGRRKVAELLLAFFTSDETSAGWFAVRSNATPTPLPSAVPTISATRTPTTEPTASPAATATRVEPPATRTPTSGWPEHAIYLPSTERGL